MVPGVSSSLPGYHGKGLYSGQGRVVYTNNGEHGSAARTDPTTVSGALAQWFGEGDWQLVRRNQFTEATGPGGIFGNEKPESDPLWTMGWDARSLILGLLENKQWYFYRLPKGSHSYDGAHGWNTEWPRIRDIGEKDLLATMHGTFWKFPKGFSRENSSGIEPRSNYLKVIGDFCRWNDRVVFGCDDTAKSEFLNVRSFKAKHGAAKQSNSNLWFVAPEQLDRFGPPIGRGSVWLRQDLEAEQTSDPFLFSGYDFRQLYLYHESKHSAFFTIEIDRNGNGSWEGYRILEVPAGVMMSHIFPESKKGAWIRITNHHREAKGVTAHFQYRDRDERETKNDTCFSGIASASNSAASFGLMRSQSFDRLGLVASSDRHGENAAYYELNPKMELLRIENPKAAAELVRDVRQPRGQVVVDEASVLLIEDGKRYRLPKSPGFRDSNFSRPAETGKTLADFLGESLARNATAKASSVHGDYHANLAIDGKLSDESRWIANNPSAGEAWLELDLREPKTFRSLWVVSGWKDDPKYAASDFDVQTRDESGEWKTIPGGEVRENAQIEREIVLEKPVTARHIRLLTRKPGYFRIYELALFDRELEIDQDEMAGFGISRICREVATERDLLNVHGTFYELPARNALGLAKIRPIATHDLVVHDFCSHNGLLFFTGLDKDTKSEHIFRSADGKAALWAGVVDDLWKLGKPRGVGGPWKNSAVKAGEFSDPYLMTAYDEKTLSLTSHSPTNLSAEIDIDGTELWVPWKTWELSSGVTIEEPFPEGFSAYWIRFRSSQATKVSAILTYR